VGKGAPEKGLRRQDTLLETIDGSRTVVTVVRGSPVDNRAVVEHIGRVEGHTGDREAVVTNT